ncbi:MAG: DUF72 domain-containing protein, partial [Caulobacteraceae bacterium]|nr:DUF72 domain-containing protein [Caulobacter sp.]
MIRVGVGGWTFEPWRGVFFPEGLPHAKELHYASRQVTAIEVNGTYYSTFKPPTFAKWREQTPDGFVFTVKASRFCTNRKVLADAGESVARFVGQGIAELGDKLGPILWQFMPTKKFDASDFAAFLALLPGEAAGVPLRHALEVRHPSFACPEFVELASRHGAAVVFADGEDRPVIPDRTAPFAYARLMDAREDVPTGYDDAALDRWAALACDWEAGRSPANLANIAGSMESTPALDVFVFMINGAKVRAPAAA